MKQTKQSEKGIEMEERERRTRWGIERKKGLAFSLFLVLPPYIR